jgi:hypothetical protein
MHPVDMRDPHDNLLNRFEVNPSFREAFYDLPKNWGGRPEHRVIAKIKGGTVCPALLASKEVPGCASSAHFILIPTRVANAPPSFNRILDLI